MKPRKIGAFLLSIALLFGFFNVYRLPANAATGVEPMVSVGEAYAILLKDDGTAWAWGLNSEGQLGTESVAINGKALSPVAVTMPTDGQGNSIKFQAVSAGKNHVLALATDGSVWAWGDNESGQLGLNTQAFTATPICVESDFGGVDVLSVVAGNCVSYALLADGTVYSWGSNANGLLGTGEAVDFSRHLPQRIETLNGIVQVSAGQNNAAALTAGGKVILWGKNDKRQCGLSGEEIVYVPQTEKGGAYSAVSVALGSIHTTLLSVDAGVTSLQNFGTNTYGQYGLGKETSVTANSTVLKATTLPNDLSGTPKAIAAGTNHMLMLTDNGVVYAWGNNEYQQLGLSPDNDASNQYTPKKLSALEAETIVSIDVAYNLNAAVNESGAVYVWGTTTDNDVGSLEPTLLTVANGTLFNLGAPSIDREYSVFVTANATVPRPTYTVTVPSKIQPDALHQKRTDAPDSERISVTSFAVSATGIANFFGEKQIEVRLSSDGDGFYLVDESNHTIAYTVYNTADGEEPFSSGEVFATFRESGGVSSTQTVTGRIEIDQSEIQFSGEYEDCVIFTVALMPLETEGGDGE